MTFKMNDRTWEIEEVSADWLLDEYKKECGDATYCFGLCRYSLQKIYINKEMHHEQKRQTLLHELMHCYIWSYVCGFNNIGEEALCDISANSHDIIHKIVENYFNRVCKADYSKTTCELDLSNCIYTVDKAVPLSDIKGNYTYTKGHIDNEENKC